MAVFDTVNDQLKEAMKARQAERLNALRNIRAGFILAMKENGADRLEDDRAFAVLRSLAKQRKDSIDAYTSAGREDLAAAERAELAIIDAFLPQLADEATTRAWVQEAIAATGATSAKEMGKVMGAVMKAHKDSVDGTLVKQIAGSLLGG
jgi:hypothetical protein